MGDAQDLTREQRYRLASYAYAGRMDPKELQSAYATATLCMICGEVFKTKRRAKVVDHDHSSGRVRGILCYNCNTLLGLAKDKFMVLVSAASYLVAHQFGSTHHVVLENFVKAFEALKHQKQMKVLLENRGVR